MLVPHLQEMQLRYHEVHVIDDPETYGKEKFYLRMQKAVSLCLASPCDEYLILPDDLTDYEYDRIDAINIQGPYTISPVNDGRAHCWGGAPDPTLDTEDLIHCDFTDCGMITNRAALELIDIEPVPKRWFNKKGKSSGVGAQMTYKFRALGVPMYRPKKSFAYHGYHPSTMHPHERKINPLVSR